MFRTHAFETVRQEKDEAGKPAPLVFRTRYELIDDHLTSVREIAKLRLPHDESVRTIQAVPVIESKHPGFGKRAVEDVDRRLFLGQMTEREVRLSIFVIVQDRVAVAESASAAILSAESDAVAFGGQSGESQCFGCRPVE